jgi:hypothetical protein
MILFCDLKILCQSAEVLVGWELIKNQRFTGLVFENINVDSYPKSFLIMGKYLLRYFQNRIADSQKKIVKIHARKGFQEVILFFYFVGNVFYNYIQTTFIKF